MPRTVIYGKNIQSIADIEAIEVQWSMILLKHAVFRFDSDRWTQRSIGPVTRDRILEICQASKEERILAL